MQLTPVLIRSAIVITSLMLLIWLISIRRRDASIVDIVWGLGFVVVAWTAFASAPGVSFVEWLLPSLTTIWGIRLSAYLLWRNHGKAEDYRYQAMRAKWGRAFPLVSLVTVFLLQGSIMWVVSLPLQVGIALADRCIGWLLGLGIVLWSIGLLFESVGDWQLARFKANPENSGHVLDHGLWRWTRHPNYFGDFLVWWGLYFVAISQQAIYWTAVGPILMSFLLMRVSGVTLLEKRLSESKSAYDQYVQRTNAFFPGPPRDTEAKKGHKKTRRS